MASITQVSAPSLKALFWSDECNHKCCCILLRFFLLYSVWVWFCSFYSINRVAS